MTAAQAMLGELPTTRRFTHWDGAVCVVAAAGLAAVWLVVGPVFALVAVLVPFALPLVWFRPEIVLAASIVLTLSGGTFALLGTIGVYLLYLCLMVLIPRAFMLRGRFAAVLLAALIVPAYVTLRMAVAGSTEDAIVIIRILAVILLVVVAAQARGIERVSSSLAWAGVVFLAASVLIGETTEAGHRYIGISGNPNRMVLGVLVLTPFVLRAGWRLKWRWRPLLAAPIGAAIWLCIASGSSQAITGIFSLILFAAVALLSRLPIRARAPGLFMQVLLIVGFALLISGRLEAGTDLQTLSGRTPLYDAAIAEIAAAPIFGSGDAYVDTGLNAPRSAHSALLGLAAASGVGIALLWAALLAAVVAGGAALAFRRDITAVALFSLVMIQFVQSVEYQPITWAVIGWLLCVQFTQDPEEVSPHDIGRARRR